MSSQVSHGALAIRLIAGRVVLASVSETSMHRHEMDLDTAMGLRDRLAEMIAAMEAGEDRVGSVAALVASCGAM